MTYRAYRFDEFELDLLGCVLLRGDKEIKLTAREFAALQYFCEHPRRLITRTTLVAGAWPGISVVEHSANEYVMQIRIKLEDRREIIETLQGYGGWRFNCKVELVESDDIRPAAKNEKIPKVAVDIQPVTPEIDDNPKEVVTGKDPLSGTEIQPPEPPEHVSPDAPIAGPSDPLPDPPYSLESTLPSEGENTKHPAADTSGETDLPVEERSVQDSSPNDGDEFLFVAVITCVVVLSILVGLQFGRSWDVNSQTAYIQAALIFGGIAYNLQNLWRHWRSDSSKDQPQLAVQQFQLCWTLLLISWLFLYFVWAIQSESNDLRVLTTLLNNSNSLTLLLCYLVLNEPTVSRAKKSDSEEKGPGLILKGVLGLIVVLVFAGLEEALLKFTSQTTNNYVLFIFDLVSGLVGGISLALCISRLHSRLLGESTWIPIVGVLLYLYVVIQPFFVLINQTLPEASQSLGNSSAPFPAPWPLLFQLKPYIIELALILKILMFLYVTVLIRRDRLLFYMTNAPRIYSDVEKEWQKFHSRRYGGN